MMDENKPWSIKNKRVKSDVIYFWKKYPHLKNRSEVFVKICEIAVRCVEENHEETIKRQKEIVDKENIEVEKDLPLSPSEKDDEQCQFYDVDRKGKPMCRNPNPPLKTSNLTVKTCMVCRRIRKEQSDEVKKKEQQEVKSFYERTKRNVHVGQERINRTIQREKQSTKEIYCPDGLYVPLTKCERCEPQKKIGCQQFKREQEKQPTGTPIT